MLATQETDTPGYEKQKQLTRAERRKLKEHSPLAHALHVAGIPTLSKKNVERYQTSRLNEYRYPKAIPWKVRDESYVFLLLFSGVAAFGFAWSLLLTIITGSLVAVIGNGVGFVLAFELVGSIVSDRPRMKTIMVTPRARQEAEWRTATLEDYTEPVPDEEREKVAELQARLPKVQAVVHYLYEDPFLEVTLQNNGKRESAFIGFWDEKGFSV